jgi:hypothetical protein
MFISRLTPRPPSSENPASPCARHNAPRRATARAEDEDVVARRPAAAIVRWRLLVTADSVPDGPHLAIMLVQVTRPPVLVVNGPYRHSQFGCDLRMFFQQPPEIPPGPRSRAIPIDKGKLCDQ